MADPKYIVREWNREIEAEDRRRAAARDSGRWKIVIWLALEFLWCAALVLAVIWLQR